MSWHDTIFITEFHIKQDILSKSLTGEVTSGKCNSWKICQLDIRTLPFHAEKNFLKDPIYSFLNLNTEEQRSQPIFCPYSSLFNIFFYSFDKTLFKCINLVHKCRFDNNLSSAFRPEQTRKTRKVHLKDAERELYSLIEKKDFLFFHVFCPYWQHNAQRW